MNQTAVTTNDDPRSTLLANVATISDGLAARVEAEERDAKLSRESHDALYEAGVLRMKLPRELGGFEADLATQFEVLEAVTVASPPAGWCSMVGTTSIGMPGAFLPEGGIARMFAGGRIPRGAILIMPTGKASKADNGYRLTGRWAFASGVHHAEWVAAHGLLQADEHSPPVLHMFVFPAGEATIHDNWDVLGLRGTGSCDISVDNIFVPADCAWNVEAQPPQRGGPLYRLGIPAFVAYEHAAFACGVARRALNNLTAYARTKKRGYGPNTKSLAERDAIQRFVGHSDLKLRAARELGLALNRDAMDTIEGGQPIDSRLALEVRGIAVYCTEVAAEIVTQAFRFSGAGSIFESHDMQRCLRDINVAAQHLMVSEEAYEKLGQTHLGFHDVQPMS